MCNAAVEVRTAIVIHLMHSPATSKQREEMLEALGLYIKLAVDVRRRTAAGGGVMHADCEAILLENGSQQEDIWGADWNSESGEVSFEALINIRPRQNNRSMEILDPSIRAHVSEIVNELLGEA
jgi:hypothetical protein